MNLTAWLLAITGPMVVRILATLGMGVVTFSGVTVLVGTLIASAQTSWAAMPSAVLGLAALAGVPEALGMVCGAFTARATLWAAMSATRLIFK